MRTRTSSPDSSGDGNATTCRVHPARNDTQDRGASTPRPAPCSELIKKRRVMSSRKLSAAGRGPAPGKQRGIEPRQLGLLKGDRRGDRRQDRLLPLEQSSFHLGPSASSQTGGSGPLPGRLLPDLIDCAEHGAHLRDPDLVVSSLDFYEVTTPADIGQRGLILSFHRSHPVAELVSCARPGIMIAYGRDRGREACRTWLCGRMSIPSSFWPLQLATSDANSSRDMTFATVRRYRAQGGPRPTLGAPGPWRKGESFTFQWRGHYHELTQAVTPRAPGAIRHPAAEHQPRGETHDARHRDDQARMRPLWTRRLVVGSRHTCRAVRRRRGLT
jgi:hypothetical protein